MSLRRMSCLLALTLPFVPGRAQAPRKPQDRGIRITQSETRPVTERRVALVIGNGAYADSPLKNPANDARAMAQALRECGFTVDLVLEANRARMLQAVRDFGQRLQAGGVGLFYFAGHGMQVKGENYLMPVGTEIGAEDEVPEQALRVNAVLAKMESAKNRLNLVVLDACRNNPFARSFRSASRGLAQQDAPTGSFIAYATAPGSVAADGAGSHGLYTQHLLQALKMPGLSVEQVFKRVRIAVKEGSRGQQVPWDSSSLTGDFYFVSGTGAAAPETTPETAPQLRPSTLLFSDDFDQVLSPEKWTTRGHSVTCSGGILTVQTAVTDQGGVALSQAFRIDPTRPLITERRAQVAFGKPYTTVQFSLVFGETASFGPMAPTYGMNPTGVVVTYANYDFSNASWRPAHGAYIGSGNAAQVSSRISAPARAPWGVWFTEKVIYDPVSGEAQLFLDGELVAQCPVGPLPAGRQFARIYLDAYGWWTPHSNATDWLRVSQ